MDHGGMSEIWRSNPLLYSRQKSNFIDCQVLCESLDLQEEFKRYLDLTSLGAGWGCSQNSWASDTRWGGQGHDTRKGELTSKFISGEQIPSSPLTESTGAKLS